MATKKKMLQAAAGVSTGPEGAWDLSYAYYDPPADLAWDISTANFVQSFSVSAQDTSILGLFFKPDGTKMYVAGNSNDSVYEYNLSTAWDVSTASYNQNFSVASQDTNPQALSFKPDGTKMYVLGNDGDDVNEYTLSTAWDISTASYSQNFSVSAQEAFPSGMFFKPDGAKMYVVGRSGDDVNEYDLSTAWDISTASYSQNFSVSAQDTNPEGLSFKADGTKMYIIGDTGDDVNEYNLSTAWDISTASYSQNFSVATQEAEPSDIFFKPDGAKMYVLGNAGDDVNEYTLGGFDVSAQELNPNGVEFKPDGSKMYIVGTTGDDVNEYNLGVIPPFRFNSQEIAPQEIAFKPDGTKMYIIGGASDSVHEYDLSIAWDIRTASFNQSFSVSAQEAVPLGLSFKTDGTKMYVCGVVGQDINEYNLSTAWDISTASYSQNFVTSAQVTQPEAVFFKSDGAKMYVLAGAAGEQDVNEYDLSTAWDVSTASFLQAFSVSTQEGAPTSLFFKSDGTKMYVLGSTGDDVNEYNLSTAWDVSTASYSQNFSVQGQENAPKGLFFKADGTQMYVMGSTGDDVNAYDLSTAWDVSTAGVAIDPEKYFDLSTASFLQSFSVASQEINPYAVRFKPDGTKMYIVGATTTSILEYSLSTAWDVSTASYVQNILYDAGDTNTRGLFFKPDGTKMYLTGVSSDAVSEYNITTAWDISTAAFSQRFSVLTEENNPNDVFFKPDGTKMYVLGTGGDDVNEYDLSTAWDVSTAVYFQNFSVAAQTTFPNGFFIKEDGTQMFIVTVGGDVVFTYSLGVQE